MSLPRGAVNVGIFHAAPHLSIDEFKQRILDFADAVTALPISQKHYSGFEIIFQNPSQPLRLRYLGALGIPTPSPQPTAWIVSECATFAQQSEISRDPTFIEILHGAAETIWDPTTAEVFSLHMHPFIEPTVPSSTSGINTTSGINKPTSRMLAAFRRPPTLPHDTFHEKMLEFAGKLAGLPISQDNLLGYSLGTPHTVMEPELRGLGFPPPPPSSAMHDLVLAFHEFQDEDRVIEWITHLEIQTFAAEFSEGLGGQDRTSVFVAEVVTKINDKA
ncbi:hypothetical protein R3P38DRAFT_303310 [Favolaschia claudopus]|uniref:Uncharacterized protein n=1 Tax=Favolaschia claudopus TaxID=2862362 RepID=A0AAW0CT73_9AGAR